MGSLMPYHLSGVQVRRGTHDQLRNVLIWTYLDLICGKDLYETLKSLFSAVCLYPVKQFKAASIASQHVECNAAHRGFHLHKQGFGCLTCCHSLQGLYQRVREITWSTAKC